MLRMRSPWVTEMHGMMEEMAMSAARRWQDALSLGSNDDDDDDDDVKTSLDMEHYDK